MSFIKMFGVMIPIAIFVILGIYFTGVDLQTTYVDRSVLALAEKFGVKKAQFALTIWIAETESQTSNRDSESRLIVPIRIFNSGVQAIGSGSRKWKLVFRTKNQANIRLVEISTSSSDLEMEKVDVFSEDIVSLQFGLFYPGESVKVQVELDAPIDSLAKAMVVDTNLPIQPNITVTRHSTEFGPPTKFGNIVFFSAMILIGLLFFYIGFSSWLDEHRPDFGTSAFAPVGPINLDWGDWLFSPVVAFIIVLGTTVHAIALTKIILLLQWLFS